LFLTILSDKENITFGRSLIGLQKNAEVPIYSRLLCFTKCNQLHQKQVYQLSHCILIRPFWEQTTTAFFLQKV